jgi:hypothetical protein
MYICYMNSINQQLMSEFTKQIRSQLDLQFDGQILEQLKNI